MQTENNMQKSATACGENHINSEIKSDNESIWLFIFVILSIIVIRFVPCDPNAPHDFHDFNKNEKPNCLEKESDLFEKEFKKIDDLENKIDQIHKSVLST